MISTEMVRTKWDTNGRLGKRAYQKSQGGLSLVGLLILIAGAAFLLNFTRDNVWLSYGVVVAVAIYAIYLQYHYAQRSIRRLHDRGLPGWLFWPVPLVGLAAIASGALLLVKVMIAGQLMDFLWNLPGLLEPLVRIYFFNGLGWWVTGLIILYNLFLWYNLNARGTPGPNRYGEVDED